MLATVQGEHVLQQLEDALATELPLEGQLELVTRVLGEALGVSRVVLYCDSERDDSHVRIRSSWNNPGLVPLDSRIAAIPLLTGRTRHSMVVTSDPRGAHCPSDCPTSQSDCVLRHACASLLLPLKLGRESYGTLAIHATTGHAWTTHERSVAQHVAQRVALQIGRSQMERLRLELAADRVGIATTVLHQLATPVTILQGAIEQIAAAAASGASGGHDFIGMAQDASAQLGRLCEDLAAVVASPRPDEETRTCDVAHQLASSVDAIRAQHPDTSIAITIVGELASARCDPTSLDKVLTRLLDNSIRYNPATPHIEVTAWSDARNVVIRLRDDGPGISATEAQRIPAPFTRLDPNMRTHPGGTGLGLAIAQRITRGARGDLRVAPRTDATGTQVTIILPIAS